MVGWQIHLNIPILTDEIIFDLPNDNDEQIITFYDYVILHTKYYIYIYKKGLDLFLYKVLLNIKYDIILKKDYYTTIDKNKSSKKWEELQNNI